VWGVPEVSDVERLESAFRAAVDEAGTSVVYVTRVPADAPAPEGECRKRLNSALAEWMKLCSSYHVVLEGQGFVAAFKRGVLTNLLQPFWRPKVVFVHARCDDVVIDGESTGPGSSPASITTDLRLRLR
jgi:hypothetical protein